MQDTPDFPGYFFECRLNTGKSVLFRWSRYAGIQKPELWQLLVTVFAEDKSSGTTSKSSGTTSAPVAENAA
ncbi:MAG: hypothetical protein FJ276_35880 [Planctomycetes bacterium]|nr:hypothetical protein [Planctomycetota bacterium]